MNSNGADKPEVAKWDPGFTRQIANLVGPVIKRYFRAEVRDLDSMPAAGGALVVSNHSGGMFTPDVLIFAPAFYDKFGFDRPVYTLAHYGVFIANVGDWLRRAGVIEASRENAAKALRVGRGGAGVPGRRLRLVPADLHGERHRLRRQHRLRQDRDRDRRADRADGVDRWPGNPIVPCPWRFDRQAAGPHTGAHGDPADQHRVSRSACPRSSRRICRYPPRSSPGFSSRSTSPRSSARIPTSRRSTSTSRAVMQAALDELARERRFPVLG